MDAVPANLALAGIACFSVMGTYFVYLYLPNPDERTRQSPMSNGHKVKKIGRDWLMPAMIMFGVVSLLGASMLLVDLVCSKLGLSELQGNWRLIFLGVGWICLYLGTLLTLQMIIPMCWRVPLWIALSLVWSVRKIRRALSRPTIGA